MVVAAHLEFPGIQSFIFRPGTLLDVIGRSLLLEELTADPDAGDAWSDGLLARTLRETAPSGVRLVRRSAGAFSVTAPDGERARAFVRRYTSEVRRLFDSVDVVVALEDDYRADAAAPARAARALLHARGGIRGGAAGLPTHGVVRCAFTGAAAENVLRDPDGAQDRAVAGELAHARAKGRELPRAFAPRAPFKLTGRIDLIAPQIGESTKTALVIVDVNKLGDRLQQLREHYLGSGGERMDERMREAGRLLSAVMRELAAHVIDRCTPEPPPDSGTRDLKITGVGPQRLELSLARDGKDGTGAPLLPVRPLVAGGDDLVFLCESRLAWSLADACMAFFDEAPEGSARKRLRDDASGLFKPANGTPGVALTVSIGMAIVPRGYSLHSAHECAVGAEQLAKQAVKNKRDAAELHRVVWRTGTTRPDDESELPAGSIAAYLRRSPAYPGVNTVGGPLWDDLIGLLDPTSPGSLNGPAEPGGTAWSEQRSWLKSRLPALLRPDADQAELTSRGADTLLARMEQKENGVLLDAVQLLDEHLALAASARNGGNA